MRSGRVVAGVLGVFWLWSAAAVYADQTLVELGKGFNPAAAKTQNAKLVPGDKALLLTPAAPGENAGIAFAAPAGGWDLSKFQDICADLKNVGTTPVTVSCCVVGPGANGIQKTPCETITLAPDQKQTLRVFITRRVSRALRAKLFGMRGTPSLVWTPGIDPTQIARISLAIVAPQAGQRLEIGNLRARESYDEAATVPDDKLLPMIDAFGQYKYKDWPGKIHKSSDFAARKREEAADLAAHPVSPERSLYGGWKNGPKLKATGFFRTEKYHGRWWFVDPEGYLFWSFGTNGIGTDNGRTPFTNRRDWFADLPQTGTPLARFFGGSPEAAYNTDSQSPSWKYYWGKNSEWFNFSGANLYRKYGSDWKNAFFDITQQRMLSWGMNTLGASSDSAILRMHKTPYMNLFGYSGKRLEGSSGYWGKFPDVFAPEFVPNVRNRVADLRGKMANDPWCIGHFVENEISWGSDGLSLALATLASPPDQPAKAVFLADLRKKYGAIAKLNAAWGTKYASWEALLKSTAPPNKRKAKADLDAFYRHTAERFFQVTNEELKKAAPHQLNLGSRFALFASNPAASRAAAKYCDVVSFNVYRHGVANLELPEGCDKPIIIGEFHFGALDRGMFHTGLVGTGSQAERAAAFKQYLEEAVDNPAIVGAHWFEFRDQATTGRGDGENYQIGLVDICDTPNPEIIQAAREFGTEMYSRRLGQ